MKQLRYLLPLFVLLIGGLLMTSPASAAVTDVDIETVPANISNAVIGQPFSVVVTVKDHATGTRVATGDIWFEQFTKTSDNSVTTPNHNPTPLTNGTNALVYALSPGGSYTVDIAYRETPTSTPIIKTRVMTVSVFGVSGGTGDPTPAPTVGSSTPVSIPNPIKCNDATCLVSQVIRYILGIIAVIATLMFVWGGVMMLTSGGNADQVRKARETLVWATIGIIVILLSWVMIKFVLQGLIGTGTK
jgi:hypothetical protein